MSLRILSKIDDARSRDLTGIGPVLGIAGSLEVRLATTKREILQVRKLRYGAFFQNRPSARDAGPAFVRRDVCRFDSVCDHLFVIDRAALDKHNSPRVVGVYRMLRQDVARDNFGFYSAGEFEIEPLLARHPNKRFLELGRSCVAPDYRGKRALELLWRGIWTYVRHHRIDALFGCASFVGIDPADHSAELSLLRYRAPTRAEWSVGAIEGRGIDIAPLSAIDERLADGARRLPPLLKGYWRIGAQFGGQAVVDAKFGTTDIFVILPVAEIEQRYIQYFSDPADAAAFAA
jgi:L-ornithine Nalpha-acyltransferase